MGTVETIPRARGVDRAEARWILRHLDELDILQRERIALRGHLVQPCAKCQYQIRTADRLKDSHLRVEREVAEVVGVAVGEHILTTEGTVDTEVVLLHEAHELRVQIASTLAEDHDGPPRRPERLGCVIEFVATRTRARALRNAQRRRQTGLAEEIGRKRDHRGSAARPCRGSERACHRLAGAVGAMYGLGKHREFRIEALEPNLLKRLLAEMRSLDLTEQHDHRGRILTRRMHADREVRGADRSGRHDRSRDTGEFRLALGHERGSALVARRDHGEGRIEFCRLDQFEKALTGNGIEPSNAPLSRAPR
ncbi:MAG: hypothetical protein WDM88_02730 [Galbitalea sp.]